MKKSLLVLLTCLAMVFAFTACGSSDEEAAAPEGEAAAPQKTEARPEPVARRLGATVREGSRAVFLSGVGVDGR